MISNSMIKMIIELFFEEKITNIIDYTIINEIHISIVYSMIPTVVMVTSKI